MTTVYANFAFDGYQIDQLGKRGTLYNYDGTPVNLREGYASFIEAMKQAHPDQESGDECRKPLRCPSDPEKPAK